MRTVETTNASVQEKLTEIFGGYKAEWLKGKIFALFTEPSYFPESAVSPPLHDFRRTWDGQNYRSTRAFISRPVCTLRRRSDSGSKVVILWHVL